MSFSDKFLEIMDSTVRPKCEPHIVAKSTNPDTGAVTTLTWDAKDIQSLSFKRTIDPVGSKLPTMELQWTEVYFGNVSVGNVPQKYNSASAYMEISLSFRQYLGFYNTWKSLKSQTWKQVKQMTWKQVKNDPVYETVEMPKLFLSAVPTAEGNKLKWTAKDALAFLTNTCKKLFQDPTNYNNLENISLPFYNPIIYLLVNSRAQFSKFPEIFSYLTNTISYFDDFDKSFKQEKPIIFSGNTNDEIRKYFATKNKFMVFGNNRIEVRDLSLSHFPGRVIPLYLQYSLPTLETQTRASRVALKRYSLVYDGTYQQKAQTMQPYGEKLLLRYDFNDIGVATFLNNTSHDPAYGDTDRAFAIYDYSDGDEPPTLNIITVKKVVSDISFTRDDIIGDTFSEDNSLYTADANDVTRFGKILDWYSGHEVIKTTTPAIFDIELGESAYVETPLIGADGKAYKPNSLLLEQTLTYSGAVKSQNIFKSGMSEVPENDS